MKTEYETLKRTHWNGEGIYDRWFAEPINNARLLSAMTYMEQIPAYYAIYQDSRGDWQAFYAAVKRISKLSEQDRSQTMREFLRRNVDLTDAVAM